MKRFIHIALTFLLMSVANNIYAQNTDSLEIVELSKEITTLKSELSNLKKEDNYCKKKIVDLRNQISRQDKKISRQNKKISRLDEMVDNLNLKSDSIEKNMKAGDEKLASLYESNKIEVDKNKSDLKATEKSLSDKTTYYALSLLVIIIIAVILAIYFLIRKIKSGSSSVNSSVLEVKKAQKVLEKAYGKLQEETIQMDNKLIKLIEEQLESNKADIKDSGEVDHSLVLKVADELTRMETNLSRMDKSIKGYKQLCKAIERIKNNFMAKDYEIVQMLGKPYNEGMKVIADFSPSPDVHGDEKIISRIIKPQINYKGEMIQAAVLIVSIAE